MSFTTFDHHMMDIALAMARRGLGTTAPNPSVGAVIADPVSGEVIARGVTQPGGRPHAEVEALRRAGARARGASLYVTLEPCAHHGKTPPCADAVVAAGIARVVVGVEDPDPRTQGQGIARLRAAGLEVDNGLCAEEAGWVTLGHILRTTQRRPFVQLKMALDEHGDVPRGAAGKPLMVTGPESRAFAHRLRAEADAILVGAGTARDDDPELTCRLPGLSARSPVRVVLAGSLELPHELKLLRTAPDVPTWIFTGGAERSRAYEAAGARVFAHTYASSIASVLATLADEGVTRVLAEGGPRVWAAFAAAGLVDEVVLIQAGAADATQVGSPGLADRHAPGLDLAPVETRRLGRDRMTAFRTGTKPI